LQVEPVKKPISIVNHEIKGTPYMSILHAFKLIVKQEGITALWRGNIAAMGLWIGYSAVQFPVYDATKKFLMNHVVVSEGSPKFSHDAVIPLVAGGFSATVATVTTYPLDIVRTKLASQGLPRQYGGIMDVLLQTYQRGGFKSFFRGLSATLGQVIPHIALSFTFYESLTGLWSRVFQNSTNLNESIGSSVDANVLRSMICGGVAGTGSKIIVYPLDMIKRRLQVQDMVRPPSFGIRLPTYSGVLHALVSVYRSEGLYQGLYKGIVPSLWKALLGSASMFTIHDLVVTLLSE
jgi:solute carrier family 25 (mitochondrial thiamine pyrophosphate transporter), member 19